MTKRPESIFRGAIFVDENPAIVAGFKRGFADEQN